MEGEYWLAQAITLLPAINSVMFAPSCISHVTGYRPLGGRPIGLLYPHTCTEQANASVVTGSRAPFMPINVR